MKSDFDISFKSNKRRFLLIAHLLSCCALYAQRFEAESAALSGGSAIQNNSNCSGGKFVAQGEGNLTFTITFQEAGFYNIYVNAAAPFGDKINSFKLNDNSLNFSLKQNPAFLNFKLVSQLNIREGTLKIEIVKSWGYINIDYIEFEKVQAPGNSTVNTTLVTANPIDGASRLYQFLYDNYSKRIISGVMTLNSMDETEWLKNSTGKEPAIIGLDFMHSGRGYSWYNNEQPIIDAKSYYNKNGIPVLCWHWRDPSRKTEEFYTAKTDFDVNKIFDESSIEYQAMISDIDFISGLLKKLQDENIPVLWRPLHEAAGGWFWWGAKGSAACKKLYQVMYDRMVNHNGLRNLIWVWTSEPNDDDWYPGDDYVDIVGRDIYKDSDHTSQILEFSNLNAVHEGKKMITLSETGSFPDVDNLVRDGAGWSWYMPWYGDFTRNSKYNSLALWKKMLSNPYVITLDEMPNLKTYTASVVEPVMVTSIHEDLVLQKFNLYPTWVDTELKIESNDALKRVTIYNSLGEIVKEDYFPGHAATIEVSDFGPGIYYVRTANATVIRIFKR